MIEWLAEVGKVFIVCIACLTVYRRIENRKEKKK